MADLPEKVILTELDRSTTDHVNAVYVLSENVAKVAEVMNGIIDYLSAYEPPAPEISQEDIIAAINATRIVRNIPTSLENGETLEYEDGNTITRSGFVYTISHSSATLTTQTKLVESDGSVADIQIRCVGNQFILTFHADLEESLDLVIF